jgi:hypothetical protein
MFASSFIFYVLILVTQNKYINKQLKTQNTNYFL